MRLFSIWPSARFWPLHSEMKKERALSTSASNVKRWPPVKSKSCISDPVARTSHIFCAASTTPLLSLLGKPSVRRPTYISSALVIDTWVLGIV